MRLVIRLLGAEVLAVELGADHTDEAPECGPPFGFSGGTGGLIEHADDCTPDEVSRGGRP